MEPQQDDEQHSDDIELDFAAKFATAIAEANHVLALPIELVSESYSDDDATSDDDNLKEEINSLGNSEEELRRELESVQSSFTSEMLKNASLSFCILSCLSTEVLSNRSKLNASVRTNACVDKENIAIDITTANIAPLEGKNHEDSWDDRAIQIGLKAINRKINSVTARQYVRDMARPTPWKGDGCYMLVCTCPSCCLKGPSKTKLTFVKEEELVYEKSTYNYNAENKNNKSIKVPDGGRGYCNPNGWLFKASSSQLKYLRRHFKKESISQKYWPAHCVPLSTMKRDTFKPSC